ncbi:MAG: S9 family peptidase [Woeseiaceae bacterium]|nr:S9 family peptidase [Woeseiaceae bacterium]
MYRTLLLLLIVVWSGPAAAERLSAEVLWKLDRLGAPVISPNGEQVVVAVTRHADDTGEAETRLWLLGSVEQPARPLTMAGASASSPVFSPDGSSLAFVSKRGDDEAGQIYVLPMVGPGEARQVTVIPTGASGLRWTGEHVYFVSNVWPDKAFEEMATTIEESKEDKVSAHVWNRMPYSFWDHWLDEERERHLYRVDVDTGEVEALTLGTGLELPRGSWGGNGEYDVAPNGGMIAFMANSRTEGIYPDDDIFLLEPGSDDARNITADNPATDAAPMFSPDGKSLAFLSQRIEGFYGDTARLQVRDLDAGSTRELHADWDRSMSGLVWTPESDGFLGAIDDAGTRRVYFIPLRDAEPELITYATNFDGLSISDNGRLVARNQSFVYPPRVVSIEVESRTVRRLDDFNDAILDDVDMGTYESVTYESADGVEIQMWVNYPPDFDSNKEYPLFLLIHGGPHGAITDSFHFRWNAQSFSSWGYVTAWPNFHGSSGFGQAFTDSINPDWATKPYADVIAAAEWFSNMPWIDSERTAAGGGSYGGYLSSILLGREHPFNTLVIHAAVYDFFSQNSADFAVHEERFGPYWENEEMVRAVSPHFAADRFRTPSLILHGQNDLRVPVGQAFELFRALQLQGVESRLVYYPDENHWILTRDNSLHWYDTVRDWIGKFAAPGPQ